MFRHKQNAVEKGEIKHTHDLINKQFSNKKKIYMFRTNKTDRNLWLLNSKHKHFGRKNREGGSYMHHEFAIWKLSKKSKAKNWWTIWQFIFELLSALDHWYARVVLLKLEVTEKKTLRNIQCLYKRNLFFVNFFNKKKIGFKDQ